MSRLPALSSRQIIRALRKVGFVEAPKRGKGSHLAFVRHDPSGTRLVIVPHGHDIPSREPCWRFWNKQASTGMSLPDCCEIQQKIFLSVTN